MLRDACYQPIRRLLKDNNGNFDKFHGIVEENEETLWLSNEDIFDVLHEFRPSFSNNQA